jgi:hypothetical protein
MIEKLGYKKEQNKHISCAVLENDNNLNIYDKCYYSNKNPFYKNVKETGRAT